MDRSEPRPEPPRRRGRPVGTDSGETRERILRAARTVINDRGYHGATFQAIAQAADLSRPTLHYYFPSREEIYGALLDEAAAVVRGYLARARRSGTVVQRLVALVEAVDTADPETRSRIAFLVGARLEASRSHELRSLGYGVFRAYLQEVVGDAARNGELAPGQAVEPVVDLLHAMLWGFGFYVGFVGGGPAGPSGPGGPDMTRITAELSRLLAGGLTAAAAPAPEPAQPPCQ